MSAIWYYVENNDRVGPVTADQLMDYIQSGRLSEQSYVWKKGFDNWKRVAEVEELQRVAAPELVIPSVDAIQVDPINWDTVSHSERIFMIRIGMDRGGQDAEYGPFSLEMLKKLFDENRINAKTYIYARGMDNWSFLADIPIFETLFAEVPPLIEETERRAGVRKPFVARMFFHDNSQVFEGVCRDISVGGLQILVSGAPVRVGKRLQ